MNVRILLQAPLSPFRPAPRNGPPLGSARRLGQILLRLMALGVFLILAYAVISRIPLVPDRHGIEALEEGHYLIGASLGAWPSDNEPVVARFEEQTGVRLDLVDVFLDWYTPVANVSHTLDHIAKRGSVPILSWEPHGFTTVEITENSDHTTLRDGRRMSLHAYLDEFAQGVCDSARKNGQSIMLRPMHEMNGDWFSWGSGYTLPDGTHPNTDASYHAAWIKIHDAFESRCPGDVLFVWAVNHISKGTGSSFTGTYPGPDYVDYIGLDGYNWGTHADWGWQSFHTIFRPSYCAVQTLPDHPILIAEIASSEEGGDKAAWIREMFSSVTNGEYPGTIGIVYFNAGKYEIETRGALDWHVDSSARSLAAFSEGAKALAELREENPPPEATPNGPEPCDSQETQELNP